MKKMSEELVNLTKDIISIRSLSLEEIELMNFIKLLLEKNNIDFFFDKYNFNSKTTANIYVEVGDNNAKDEDILVLYSHTDVVNGKDEQFIPKIVEDKLYGRGSVDMKSSLSSMLYVLLKDYNNLKSFKKKVIFAFISDEENSASGIMRFVKWCQNRNYKNFFTVLFEPSDNFNRVDVGGRGYHFLDLYGDMSSIIENLEVILGEKEKLLEKFSDKLDGFGSCSLEITKIDCSMDDYFFQSNNFKFVSGKSSHASRPDLGVNALEKCLLENKVSFLKTLDCESSNTIPSKVFYLKFDEKRNEILNNRNHIKACIDIRTNLVGSVDNNLLNEVLNLISSDINVFVRDFGRAFVSDNKDLIDIIRKSKLEVFNKGNVKEVIAEFGSDAPYLLDLTSNIIAGFGPGLRDLCHSDCEWIDLDVLNKTPDLIRAIVKNFLSLNR